MRSFRVTRVVDPERRLQIGDVDWGDLSALACRRCEDQKGAGTEGTEFIPDMTPAVGARLCCPFCGEQSLVPKKARWT